MFFMLFNVYIFSNFQHVSDKNCVPLPQTTKLCHIQSVSIIDSLGLSLTVCV